MNTTKDINKMNNQNNIDKEQEIQEQLRDDFFRYATEELINQIAEEASNHKEDEFEPSKEFCKKMKKMVAVESRKEYFENNRTKFIKVAAGAAVVCAAASVTIINVEAFRVPIFNFFVEVQDKFSRVNLQKEGEEDVGYDLEHIYKEYPGVALPMEVPEGFRYVETKGKEGNYVTIYSLNESSFTINQVKGTGATAFDTETTGSKIIKYNSKEYTIKREGKKITLVWEEQGNTFHISGELSEKQVLGIADSMYFSKK